MNEKLIELLNCEFKFDYYYHNNNKNSISFRKDTVCAIIVYLNNNFIYSLSIVIYDELINESVLENLYIVKPNLTIQQVISIVKLILSIYDK